MRSIDDLPLFEDVDDNSPVIGFGSEARIFQINSRRKLVAKVYHRLAWNDDINCLEGGEMFSTRTVRYAQMEASLAKRLYAAGVSVPRPEGLFAISFPRLDIPLVPAVVMESIDGKYYHRLSDHDKEQARDAFDEELEKVRVAGFIPANDTFYNWNVLYTVNNDKIKAVLFDFGGWKERKRGLSLL